MTQTLLTTIPTSDMLVIDGLYTFDFRLEDQHLHITTTEGREEKRWNFDLQQLQAATFDDASQSWTLTDGTGEHRLVCMNGATGNNNDEDEADDDA